MTRLTPGKAAFDPRTQVGSDALAEAATNAFPIVARRSGKHEGAGLLLGISIALLLGAGTLFSMSLARSQTAGEPQSDASASVAASEEAPQTVSPAALAADPATGGPTGEATAPAMAGPGPAMAPPVLTADPAAAGQPAPTLVFDGLPSPPEPTAVAMATPPPPADTPRKGARLTGEGMTPDEQFLRRITGDDGPVSATSMTSPGVTVAQGTLIAAVLETALNSDLPGYARAMITRDVRSFDGRSVLIPRGSKVIGEYKSGLAVGQTRAFVLWTRLIRPDGVSVAIGSPATDSAGSNGLAGKVNSHFGKRFGAAILLSLISAGGEAIGGGGGVVIAGPAQAATSLAQRDINIPPTVRVAAGVPIRIFVARDLDFSTIGQP